MGLIRMTSESLVDRWAGRPDSKASRYFIRSPYLFLLKSSAGKEERERKKPRVETTDEPGQKPNLAGQARTSRPSGREKEWEREKLL